MWDLTYYHLDIKVDPENKFISGKNTIQYKVLKADSVMQIDLQSPLKITKVVQDNIELDVKHDGNAHFIKLQENQDLNTVKSLDVYYEATRKKPLTHLGMAEFLGKKTRMEMILLHHLAKV